MEENNSYKERQKVEQKLLCPYGPHLVTVVDYPFHLSKCRKKDSNNLINFQVCAYNRCHHFAVGEMENHLKNCKSRQNLLLKQVSENRQDPEEQLRQLSIRRAQKRLLGDTLEN